jgi:hypothetical protein
MSFWQSREAAGPSGSTPVWLNTMLPTTGGEQGTSELDWSTIKVHVFSPGADHEAVPAPFLPRDGPPRFLLAAEGRPDLNGRRDVSFRRLDAVLPARPDTWGRGPAGKGRSAGLSSSGLRPGSFCTFTARLISCSIRFK